MSSCQLRIVLSFELLNKENAVYIRPNSMNIILRTYCQLQNNLFFKSGTQLVKLRKSRPDKYFTLCTMVLKTLNF